MIDAISAGIGLTAAALTGLTLLLLAHAGRPGDGDTARYQGGEVSFAGEEAD